jgi:hypothetical protein
MHISWKDLGLNKAYILVVFCTVNLLMGIRLGQDFPMDRYWELIPATLIASVLVTCLLVILWLLGGVLAALFRALKTMT